MSNWILKVLVVPVPCTIKRQFMEGGREGEEKGGREEEKIKQ